MCDTSLGGFNLDPSALILGSAFKGKKGPATPAPRSLEDEISSILDVMGHVQPQASRVSNAYSQSEAANLGDIYTKYVGPLSRALSAQANTAQRTADVGDVGALGGQAVQSILNADPQQRTLRNATNQSVLGQLAMGTQADPAQARQSLQQIRATRTSQGFGQGSNNDLLTEAIGLGNSGQQLYQQRLGNAQSVMQQNQQQTGDPFMAVLGRPGQSLGFAQGAYGQSQANKPNTDPFANQYGQDLYNTNFNAAYANVFSQRNQQAADKAALYGLIGSIIGGGSKAAAGGI